MKSTAVPTERGVWGAPNLEPDIEAEGRRIQGLIRKRQQVVRLKGFDPEKTPLDNKLETMRTLDAGQPGKTRQGFVDYALKCIRFSQAQVAQDIWASYENDGKKGGYFVDFGATNGTTLSNSLMLERQFGWSGIVSEPNPIFHERLHKTRKCHISTKCVHSISRETLPFICSTRPMMSRLANTTGKMEAPLEERGEVESVVEVETISLNDLLDEYSAPKEIDFISIDTEGSELEILSAFDFSKRFVHTFAIEHNYEPRRKGLLDLMEKSGYVRRFPELSLFDDWYIHKSLIN